MRRRQRQRHVHRLPTPLAYQGLDRFAARKQVVADMEALGLLDKIEEHS
jgi:valyl-tRNA synthetase